MHACRIASLQWTNMAMNTPLAADERKLVKSWELSACCSKSEAIGCVINTHLGSPIGQRPTLAAVRDVFVRPSV